MVPPPIYIAFRPLLQPPANPFGFSEGARNERSIAGGDADMSLNKEQITPVHRSSIRKESILRQFKYDVCLSFANEQRDYVNKVRTELIKAGLNPFYDEDEGIELWGKNLNEALDEIYRKTSRFCVMFISSEYAKKSWTIHERRSAQARALIERDVYILPARFDDTDIDGLPPTVRYIDLRDLAPEEFAQLIIKKVKNGGNIPKGSMATEAK